MTMGLQQQVQPLVITIDGPAGTGKSTVAHHLAQRLGLDFLDTGAMYRASALIALEREIDPADGPALAEVVETLEIGFDWKTDPPRVCIDTRDVSERIRDMDVSRIVSIVAAQPELRHVLVRAQRRIARAHPRIVSEGRDQGSVVFPRASVRFYLDASPAIRARRRIDQLRALGKDVDEQAVLADIEARDRRDSARAAGPLIKPEGAVVIETGDRSIDEVVDVLEAHVREQVSPDDLDP